MLSPLAEFGLDSDTKSKGRRQVRFLSQEGRDEPSGVTGVDQGKQAQSEAKEGKVRTPAETGYSLKEGWQSQHEGAEGEGVGIGEGMTRSKR